MQAHIERLVKLQSVDLERTRVNAGLRGLPAEIAQAQTELAAAERQAAESSGALSREETLRTRLEREIAGFRQKTARFKTQLDVVKTPEQAAAIEHEIGFSTGETERLENEELASMERSEAQEAALSRMVQAGAVRVTAIAALLEWQRDWAKRDHYNNLMGLLKPQAGAYGIGVEYAYTMVHHAPQSAQKPQIVPKITH